MFKKKEGETGPDAVVAVADAAEDIAVGEAPAEALEADAAVIADDAPETPETAAEDATGEETAAEGAAEDDPALDGDEDDDEEEEEEEEEDDGISLDLMDIFESEQAESTSTAGVYSEFLDSLTMEDVLEEAEGLLDEMQTMFRSG